MRTAVYHGVEPYQDTERYVDWNVANPNRLTVADANVLLKEARNWLGTGVLATHFDRTSEDVRFRAALDTAIRTAKDGAYSVGVPPPVYERLLRNLIEGFRKNATTKSGAEKMVKLSTSQANGILSRLDKIAATIQQRHAAWGMPFKTAKSLVNELDRTADEIEIGTFGKESFLKRQAEVLQSDSDESYMGNFENPMEPIQTDADEAYMQAYADDQSSAVQHGKSSTGRPLAP